MQCTPAAFLGEFDALDGPSISYAFEYFHYANDCGGSDNGNDMSFLHVQHRLAYVTGNSLIGRHVASGSLNPEYAPYMQQVASRALVSNEREDETVMFQDPDCPFVASYSFCLADILARGERRRFCIIFIHPSAALLSRWTQLMKHLRHRIDLWRSTAEGRQREEYSSIPDLEQRRESARRERLRSFMELIAPGPCTTAEESFRSVHIFFESLFPTVFSSTPKPLILNNLEPSDGESERRRLEALQIQAECATEFVESGRAAVEKDIIFLRSSTRHMLLAPSSFVVQPLSVWLVDFAHCNGFPTDVWKSSLSLLLESLCSGNQILVTGERASDCANLAISLAQILPRSLSSLRIGSSRYLMPYECRILSFDQAWLDANEISNRLLAKYAGQQQHTASTTKNRWEFPEMGSGEVVNVVVATNGHISSIHEVQTWGSPGAQSALARECSSTLVTRMCADLEACAESIKEGDSLPSNISAYQLFQARLGQLIREYVLRGRVYTQLYQMQEVNANNGVLNLVRQPSHSSRNGSSFAFLHNWLRTLGSLTQGNTSACHSGEANVEKQLRLRAESVERRLGKQQFTFTSFSNEDHAVLTFLGSRQFYAATD